MTFDDRVAVAALALLEGPTPQSVDGLRGVTLDERAHERFQVLPQGRAVAAVLRDVGAWPRSFARWAVAAAVLLVGVGSAALVASTGAVSVPAVLVGTLAVQTVLLLLWLVALVPILGSGLRRAISRLLLRPLRGFERFGRGVLDSVRTPDAVTEWLGRWRRGAERDHAIATASLEAIAMAYAPRRSALAALVYGAWSNAAWVAANALMLLVLAVQLLRSRNYTLHSGLISPELSRAWVDAINRVLGLALPPSMLPDAAAMARASVEPSGIPEDSWKWGAMLLASVAAFGLLPRVVALAATLAVLPVARRRWRIPWDDARLAATRGVIEASAPPVTVVARERAGAATGAGAPLGERPPPGLGGDAPSGTAAAIEPCALLRVGESAAWTPRAGTFDDLGDLARAGLADAESIAARIERDGHGALLVLCSVALAPRLGIADLLRPPLRAVKGRASAVLSGAARGRRGSRLADLGEILRAWRALLASVGVTNVLEVDLSYRAPRAMAQLEALLSGHVVRAAPAGRLAKSLESIVDAAESWGERHPSGRDERRLLDRLGTIHGVDDLTREAPFVVALDDEPGVVVEAAQRAAGAVERASGLATLEAMARAADRRSRALRGAVMLAVELEYQGCGEESVNRAIDTALSAWDGAEPGRAGTIEDRRERVERALLPRASP